MQAYCEGTELNLESAEESSIQYVGTNSNICGHKSIYFEGCFVRTGNARYNDLCDILYDFAY